MKTRRILRPAVEPLESLALLSGAAAGAHVLAHVRPLANRSAAITAITPAPLSGTIRGVYVGRAGGSQAGASYHFFGGGRVDPIGRAFVGGNIHVSSLITTGGQASGSVNGNDTLYVRGRGGRLTLHVTATTTMSSDDSVQLTATYTVTSATGAFQAEQGESGTISASLHSFLPSFIRSDNFDVGRFSMTFSTTTAAV